MKHILVTLLLLFSLLSQAQEESRNFGIAEVFRGGDSIFIKKLKTVVIKVHDGLVTRQDTNIDSARLFISSDGSLYQGVITWKKVGGVVVPPVTEKIDGEKASFSVAPNPVWSNHSPNVNWSGGTIAFSNAPGSTATYTFTGTKVELWAERLASHGTGTVKIDTGAEQTVSFKDTPLGLPVKIYESATLPLGVHTIVLKCVSGYVLLDYLIIHKN